MESLTSSFVLPDITLRQRRSADDGTEHDDLRRRPGDLPRRPLPARRGPGLHDRNPGPGQGDHRPDARRRGGGSPYRHDGVRLSRLPARRLRPGAGPLPPPHRAARRGAPPRAERGTRRHRGLGQPARARAPPPAHLRRAGRLVRQGTRRRPRGRRVPARQLRRRPPRGRPDRALRRRPDLQVLHPPLGDRGHARHAGHAGRPSRQRPGAARPGTPRDRGVPGQRPVGRGEGRLQRRGRHRHRGRRA